MSAPGDPYRQPFRVQPQAGLLVVFPSWLYHWVHPYAGERPRIAVSFNATVEVRPMEQAWSSEAAASDIAHKIPCDVGIVAVTRERSLCHVGHEPQGQD